MVAKPHKSVGGLWVRSPKDSKTDMTKVQKALDFLKDNKVYFSMSVNGENFSVFFNGYKDTEKKPDLVVRPAIKVEGTKGGSTYKAPAPRREEPKDDLPF